MPKYRCYGTIVGSKYLGVVEADNPEEAERNAWELDSTYISLCHQCAPECEDAAVTEVSVEEMDEDEEEITNAR